MSDKLFTFDGVFVPEAPQDEVYEVAAGSFVEHLFNGLFDLC